MKKAKIKLLPIEVEYLRIYKESDYVTIEKLKEKGFTNDEASKEVKKRYDEIWNDMRKRKQEQEIRGLGENPFFPT